MVGSSFAYRSIQAFDGGVHQACNAPVAVVVDLLGILPAAHGFRRVPHQQLQDRQWQVTGEPPVDEGVPAWVRSMEFETAKLAKATEAPVQADRVPRLVLLFRRP